MANEKEIKWLKNKINLCQLEIDDGAQGEHFFKVSAQINRYSKTLNLLLSDSNQPAVVHELKFNNLNGHDAEAALTYKGEKPNKGCHFNMCSSVQFALARSNHVVNESLIKLGIL